MANPPKVKYAVAIRNVDLFLYLRITRHANGEIFVMAPTAFRGRHIHASYHLGGVVSAGARQFRAQGCADCHMIAGVGVDFGPELTHVGGRLSRAQMEAVIVQGKGAMPAFPGLTSTDLTTLLDYLQSLK